MFLESSLSGGAGNSLENYVPVGSVYIKRTKWVTAASIVFCFSAVDLSLFKLCAAQVGSAAANQGAACTRRFSSPIKFRISMLVWSLPESIFILQIVNYKPGAPISDNHLGGRQFEILLIWTDNWARQKAKPFINWSLFTRMRFRSTEVGGKFCASLSWGCVSNKVKV